MTAIFPSQEWLENLETHLNTNEKYEKIAKKWEGDIAFDIKADGALENDLVVYLDLWHGKCRGAKFINADEENEAAFILSAPFSNFVRVLKGELDPIQAMLTRKLAIKGSMAYMMRNIPTVLEFVRCAQFVTDKVLGE
ncbi:MAG: SCP2 sterol-binding domain-containing protein [Chloroflexota bacterium]